MKTKKSSIDNPPIWFALAVALIAIPGAIWWMVQIFTFVMWVPGATRDWINAPVIQAIEMKEAQRNGLVTTVSSPIFYYRAK